MKSRSFLSLPPLCLCTILIFISCGQQQQENEQSTDSPPVTGDNTEAIPHNTLTEEEIEEGWTLLFDGETTNEWRKFKGEGIGPAWQVENGTLTLHTDSAKGWQAENGGDIITDKVYENFELTLEWKIEEGGNSGIIYHVLEEDRYDHVWQIGPEMQILDNEGHPDGKIEKHRAGDLYDLIKSGEETVNPPTQWNKVRLISNNGHIEHWLNGTKVVEYDMDDPSWRTLIEGSKFKDMPGFGTSQRGHIALQDHGDRVWFRNIKIRQL